ncbi:MAG: penicillin-binding transpeptidase domain-containing protein [Defluviitaleaceae bacterium]|nr:penicillin-binding transpeptidase domain-containing protein [Defluviitaleaceae bacterium]
MRILLENKDFKPPMAMRRKLLFVMLVFIVGFAALFGRMIYIQTAHGDMLQARAYEQHTRDRLIRPDRGNIYDRNGIALASTLTVATVSVIRAQVQDANLVAETLANALDMDFDEVLTKVNRRVALERIKSHVDLGIANELRRLDIPGIIIDEDVARVYPFNSLAAQVIGFVGIDNQGIIGLEAKYDEFLAGQLGKILTETDARGIEFPDSEAIRVPPVDGFNLITTLDSTIQHFAQQTIAKAVEAKQATRGAIIVINPQTGEILALANEPTFDLNEPFLINNDDLATVWETFDQSQQMHHLNQMWRNFVINDTYEPGSTFKIITSAAGLQEGVIGLDTMFVCAGFRQIGGHTIRCWRSPRSHGSLNFLQGVENSCNPVFMEIGERLGAELLHDWLGRFGFNERTGVDLPGEAVGIMFAPENIGPVEVATISFGQGFQITPLQLLRASAAAVNGGYMITPHVGHKIVDNDGMLVEEFFHPRGRQVISPDISDTMKEVLESVVYVGTGNRSYIPGYRIGGKTATSQKLPRGSGRYISSFLTFAPAEDPQIMALVIIDEPKGAYYGGQVAGPVMKELLSSVLPYLEIEPIFNEEELQMDGVGQVVVPNVANINLAAARHTLHQLGLETVTMGSGRVVDMQFPLDGEMVNQGTRVILYLRE